MSQRRRIASVILMSTASLAVASSAAHATSPPPVPPPPSDDKADRHLLDLRRQLANQDRESALAKMKVFRPLCDAHGYPLVGNLAVKAPMFQTSDFCAAVREAEAKPQPPSEPPKTP